MNLNELFEKYRITPCETSLTEVLKASQNLIYRIIVKVANHDHDSEDLTQEVLIKVIQNINILPKDTNFGGWLNRTSLNTAINYYHHRQRLKTIELQEVENPQFNNNNEEVIAIIYQHLSQLENADESMIINKYIHQMTYAEMSSFYKLPKSTIESKINNILGKLKGSLEKAGFAGVAQSIASTFDQLKGAEISHDLLPNIKNHYPANYPKVKPEFFSSKVVLKVLAPVVAVLISYFTINYLSISNSSEINSTTELGKFEKQFKINDEDKANVETNKKNQKESEKEIETLTSATEVKEIIKNDEFKPMANIEQKSTIETTFAGQLIDAETKAPIPEAKIEIWDIYTYEKFETATDAEGKYFVPKGLDTTFFFFLKFFKEGYIVRQTFQHFEIHSKILLETNKINRGKKTICKLDFVKSASGDLYLGSNCDLTYEPHLSSNQKNILKNVYSCIIKTAPFDLYTFKKIKIENRKDYTINESFKIPEGERYNFAIWNSSNLEQNFTKLDSGSSSSMMGEYFQDPYKMRLASTGKVLENTSLNIFNFGLNEKFSMRSDQKGAIPFYSTSMLRSSIFSIGNNDFFAENWTAQTGEHFYDYELGRYWYLFPCTSVNFEPLSLNREFHNSQVIFGDMLYSKKSLNRKSKNHSGNLNVYDKFFEKTILVDDIKIHIGGEVDINSKLNSNDEKETKIQIFFNNKPLRERNISISKRGENEIEFSSSLEVRINENGFCLFKIPKKTKNLLIHFTIDRINYSKLIEVVQISNDNLTLKFNRKLEIKLNQSLREFNEKSNYNIKNIYYKEGTFVATKEYYDARIYKRVINENTSISFSNSQSSLFVEEGAEYEIIENEGSGIKTKYHQLIAAKCSVKSDSTYAEILPVEENEYLPIQFEISDEIGNELKMVNWKVLEINNFFTNDSDRLSRLYLLKDKEGSDPCSLPTVDDLSEYGSLTPKYVEDMIIGEEAIKNKTICLLANRKYYIFVYAEGFVDYIQPFSTKDFSKINKKIILRKANSVKFKPNFKKETNEIAMLLKANDVIFEYDDVRIFNKTIFENTQNVCNKETVSIKLLRNDKVVSISIPSFQIHGLEDYFYEDKEGLLIR